MKWVKRIILTSVVLLAGYYFVYWSFLSLIPGIYEVDFLPEILSLLIAIALSIFVWKNTLTILNSLLSYVVLGGIFVGLVGFSIGFFGPIIFNFGGNQGPLIGILFTGPIGIVLGMIGGAAYWKANQRRGRV